MAEFTAVVSGSGRKISWLEFNLTSKRLSRPTVARGRCVHITFRNCTDKVPVLPFISAPFMVIAKI